MHLDTNINLFCWKNCFEYDAFLFCCWISVDRRQKIMIYHKITRKMHSQNDHCFFYLNFFFHFYLFSLLFLTFTWKEEMLSFVFCYVIKDKSQILIQFYGITIAIKITIVICKKKKMNFVMTNKILRLLHSKCFFTSGITCFMCLYVSFCC